MSVRDLSLSQKILQRRTIYGRIIQSAYNSGIPVVTAAQNAGGPPGPSVPCAYQSTVCVASLNRRRRKAERYNYEEDVNVTAPGEQVKTLRYFRPRGRFQMTGTSEESGTSIAAPHIMGILAIFMGYERIVDNAALAIERLYQNQDRRGVWQQDFPNTPGIGLGNTGIEKQHKREDEPYLTF